MFDRFLGFILDLLSFFPPWVITLLGSLVAFKAVLFVWQLIHGG